MIWSSELKDNSIFQCSVWSGYAREHQLEVFYDVHFTPWLQLIGDLQIIHPNRPGTETSGIVLRTPAGRFLVRTEPAGVSEITTCIPVAPVCIRHASFRPYDGSSISELGAGDAGPVLIPG